MLAAPSGVTLGHLRLLSRFPGLHPRAQIALLTTPGRERLLNELAGQGRPGEPRLMLGGALLSAVGELIGGMMASWIMSDAEIAALDKLIDHVARDEAEDFRARPYPDHIYLAIYTLAKWRGRDVRRWPVPDGANIARRP